MGSTENKMLKRRKKVVNIVIRIYYDRVNKQGTYVMVSLCKNSSKT